MKKEREFPYSRIPAFVVYGIAAACVVLAFFNGKHLLFTGMVWYIIGMMFDPKSDVNDESR